MVKDRKGVTNVTTRKRPACVDALLAASDAAEAHAFLLHGGGTEDYMRPGVDLRQYLARMFSPSYLVVSYSVSRGFRFGFGDPAAPANFEMRKLFHETLGMEDKNPSQPLLAAPAPAVSLLMRLMREARPNSVVVMLDHADNIVGEQVPVDGAMIGLMEMLHDQGTEEAIAQSGNLLIMFAPSLGDVKAKVRTISSGIKMIEVPLPGYAQRLDFVNEWLETEAKPIKLVGITVEVLATITAGLYLRHVETVLLRARQNKFTLTRELALAVQREMMDTEYAGIIKRVERTFKLSDVGGHYEAKGFTEQKIIARSLAGKRTPNAVLWVGPPGTGKTMMANALANESGQNCLEVDFANLLGSLVGQTEGNIAKLRQCIVSNAPCQIICDEIDQKIRRGEGGADSGGGGAVENRLFSAVLELVENLKDLGVTWHFMSNRPDLLDEAFMSRMHTVIPLLPAEDDTARADVLTRIVSRLGGTLSTESAQGFAGRLTGWSGRDVEHAVTDALAAAEDNGVPLSEALDETITYRRVKVLDVKTMVAQALDACKDDRLIPAKYREAVSQAAEQAQPAKRMQRITAVTDWPGTK